MVRRKTNSRKRKRRRTAQRGGGRSSKSPSVRWLLAWTLSLALFALGVDWLMYREMAEHHDKYGHWPIPSREFSIAFVLTGVAISLPVLWILERRKCRR